MKVFRRWFLFPTILLVAYAAASPQNNASSTNSQKAQSDQSAEEQDQPVEARSAKLKTDQHEALLTAWEMMQSTSDASKPPEHVSLLVALGTLGGYKQTEDMLTAGMKDTDVDVRLAAVAAAGATEDRNLIPALRIAMDDHAPEVVVTAAASLWKMGDHTGIDVLQGVLTGQMKAKSNFLKSGLHTVNRDLHDPSAMATIGAEEGAGMLFGPFGFALAAVKMAHPGPSPNSARVIVAGLLAEDQSESNKQALIQTIQDKDPYVRQASAKALAKFRGKDVTDALLDGFDDPKPSVRFMAAASYIRIVSPLKSEVRRRPVHSSARKKTQGEK